MRLLHTLVTNAARRSPDAEAVRAFDGPATYAELDALAEAAGLKLLAAGVEAGDRVGLWLDKSVLAIAAMQACLRVGAVYVPIDPLSPTVRAQSIVADAGARLVITTPERRAEVEVEVLCLEPGKDAWRELIRDGSRLPSHASPVETELAYILYTSGSTGTPKGVCISHLNARAYVDWAVDTLALSSNDRLSSHAPFHFDLSVLDLYGAFAAGACVSLLSESAASSPKRLVEYARTEQITVWYSVPSALILMMQHGRLLDASDWQPRVLCFAGEAFSITHLRTLRHHWPEARFFNLYGPTETNVCTYYEVHELDPARTQPVPIGAACSGDEVWVETDEGSRASVGESGELLVSGPTVMLGYWGRAPQSGAYRTGDLVRVEPDGNLYFLGRRDHMVKLRGHRVELGEVEAALAQHAGVREVAVVAHGEGLDARLIAFVVPEGERAPSLLALKRQCAERVPSYMIVDRVRSVAELPLTRNGKVDRRALVTQLEGDT